MSVIQKSNIDNLIIVPDSTLTSAATAQAKLTRQDPLPQNVVEPQFTADRPIVKGKKNIGTFIWRINLLLGTKMRTYIPCIVYIYCILSAMYSVFTIFMLGSMNFAMLPLLSVMNLQRVGLTNSILKI